MTDTLVIALPFFFREAERIAIFLGADTCMYSQDTFSRAVAEKRRIVAIMSMGIVVRKIAPLLSDKWTDPAIVVVSPDMRYAIPLIGGHHGANRLAKELAGMGLVPVITTATESTGRDSVEEIAERNRCEVINRDSTRRVNAAMLAADVPVHAVCGPAVVIAGPDVSVLMKNGEYSVGIGCRKGVETSEVVSAIDRALAEAGIAEADVQVYATTVKKLHETGLIAAVSERSGNLIFLDDKTINAQAAPTPSRASRIGLAGVAEPCALATAKRKELVAGKKVYGRVTIAIAR